MSAEFTTRRGHVYRSFPVTDHGNCVTVAPHLEGLLKAFGELLKMPDRFAERAKEVRADPNLSDQGKKAALASWAREHGAAVLRQMNAAYSEAEARRSEFRQKMAAGAIDKTDVAGALLRQELRSWLRDLPPAKRTALLMNDDPDPQLAAAVIEAPAELTGVTAKLRENLTMAAAALRHPSEARALAELDQAVEAVGDAWRVARKEIEAASDGGVVRELEAAAGLRSTDLTGTSLERVAAIKARFPELQADA